MVVLAVYLQFLQFRQFFNFFWQLWHFLQFWIILTMTMIILVAFETLITILTIENLKSLWPDNEEWRWTALAILAMFSWMVMWVYLRLRFQTVLVLFFNCGDRYSNMIIQTNKPWGRRQKSEVNKRTFRSRIGPRIGSLGTVGNIIFDILEPPAV